MSKERKRNMKNNLTIFHSLTCATAPASAISCFFAKTRRKAKAQNAQRKKSKYNNVLTVLVFGAKWNKNGMI